MKKEIHKSKHKPSMLANVKERRRRVITRLEEQLIVNSKETPIDEYDKKRSLAVNKRITKELDTLKTRT